MRASEQGFTLLEMLVALAVFSLAALALVNLAGENTRTAGVVEARTLAAVVAENRAIETLTAPAVILGESEGAAQQAGRDWRWVQDVSETDDPAIWRIHVAVRGDGFGDQVLSEVTVFRGAS